MTTPKNFWLADISGNADISIRNEAIDVAKLNGYEGIIQRYKWSDLQSAKNTFNSTTITAIGDALDRCEDTSGGKRAIKYVLCIERKGFGNGCVASPKDWGWVIPQTLRATPNGCQLYSGQRLSDMSWWRYHVTPGATSFVWLKALIAHVFDQFGYRIFGFMDQETATGWATTCGDDVATGANAKGDVDYNPTNAIKSVKDFASWFLSTYSGWCWVKYFNFIDSGNLQIASEFASASLPSGFVYSAPDVLPAALASISGAWDGPEKWVYPNQHIFRNNGGVTAQSFQNDTLELIGAGHSGWLGTGSTLAERKTRVEKLVKWMKDPLPTGVDPAEPGQLFASNPPRAYGVEVSMLAINYAPYLSHPNRAAGLAAVTAFVAENSTYLAPAEPPPAGATATSPGNPVPIGISTAGVCSL